MAILKLPKSFRPKKDLDEKIENLIKGEYSNVDSYHALSKAGSDFLELQKYEDCGTTYVIAEEFASNLHYGLDDVKNYAESIKIGPAVENLGFFISALINQHIKRGERIELNLEYPLSGLGAKFKEGGFTVFGDVGSDFGYGMKGGQIQTTRSAGYFAGLEMEGGNLIINKNAGIHLGCRMTGGELCAWENVYGDIGNEMEGGIITIHREMDKVHPTCKGSIYHKYMRIWPKRHKK